jgi:KaiC/GvpD/RAD55 family RecA-like ATPase
MADSNSKSFSDANWNEAMQERIMQSMIVDKEWAGGFLEVFSPDFFDDANMHLKALSKLYIKHHQRYKEFPSVDLLEAMSKESFGQDKPLLNKIDSFLVAVRANQHLGDLSYAKEKSLEWCKRQKTFQTVLEATTHIDEGNYDLVVQKIKEVASFGITQSQGLNYTEDFDRRYSKEARKPVSTGIAELDDKVILNGGLAAKEIGIVVAPTNHGKSHVLIQFGAEALLRGKTVFHFTMELPEEYVGLRYDSYITKIGCSDLESSKDVVREEIERLKTNGVLGNLIIKEYAAGVPSVGTLRSFIEKMAYKNYKPDIIIVDYAALIRSIERHEHMRIELQLIIRELKALAKEMGCPVWTALQSNKEGSKNGVVDETNLAESYAQAAEADFIVGLFQKGGYGTLHVAKNRMGIKDRTFGIHLDTARSTLQVLPDDPEEETEGSTTKGIVVKAANSTDASKSKEFKKFLKERQEKLKEVDTNVKIAFNE